ncbi:hypothetical protein XELAEV_18002028mg [Xenopus laevis]|uniref:Uncharacterized protein n=1 Tax=Xenopus laevis TaxID=8355 RepID=A0A974BPL9_XENLA|nr:hypothetical protein XELAEV_18002028mg [Xenopus laevis]
MEWRGMQCSPSSLKALPCICSHIPLCFNSLHYNFTSAAPLTPKIWSTFKSLGRPCIPVHSIPQTVEAGSTGCVGSNRMKCSVHIVA